MAIRIDPPMGVHTFFLGGTLAFKKADAMAKLNGWSIYDNGVEVYFVEKFDFKGRMYLQVYFAKGENHFVSFDVHEVFKVNEKEKDMDNSHFSSQTSSIGNAETIKSDNSAVIERLQNRIKELEEKLLTKNEMIKRAIEFLEGKWTGDDEKKG